MTATALALGLWLAAAVAFVALGGLQLAPPPHPQLVLASLVVLLLGLYGLHAPFRARVQAVPTRALVAVHLSRFVGLYFLWLYRTGELPRAFAVPAGWGDIAVATLALPLAAGRVSSAGWLQAWNLLGLADILFVVATAVRLALSAPESMAPLTRLPLGLLVTFLVPLIVVTHVVIGVRARRGAGPAG
jgi:hypothetical protein